MNRLAFACMGRAELGPKQAARYFLHEFVLGDSCQGEQHHPQTGRQTTSPNEPTHEATILPGNPDRDEDVVEEVEEALEQAGGGH